MSEWAAIFDWDGVILDTSREHEAAWRRIAEREARPIPSDFFRRSFGMKNDRVIGELLRWTSDPAEIRRLDEAKEAVFRRIVSTETLELLPGVRPWLESLREAGVPCAVATSTPRPNLDCVLGPLRIEPCFRAMISAEDVTRGKPDPEVFLKAAARLGTSPERCVVFEDAHVGIAAGLAAGMRVVAVATTHPAGELTAAHRVVARMDELTVQEIDAWFDAAP